MMKILTIVVMFILITASAFSQGFGLGPVVGLHKAKDADEGNVMFGAAARLKLSPSLGVEGAIHYRKETYADGDISIKSWPVMVTGLFYPFPILYGAIGAGWYNTTIEYDTNVFSFSDRHTNQEFGWHFGAGVELPLGPRTKLSGDIRYVFIDYDFEELPGRGKYSTDFYIISVGVFFGL